MPSLSVLNSVVIKVLGPVAAMTVATYTLENGYGLLNQFPLPFWLQVLIGFVILSILLTLEMWNFNPLATP